VSDENAQSTQKTAGKETAKPGRGAVLQEVNVAPVTVVSLAALVPIAPSNPSCADLATGSPAKTLEELAAADPLSPSPPAPAPAMTPLSRPPGFPPVRSSTPRQRNTTPTPRVRSFVFSAVLSSL
jgi:hypothetical protein